MLIDTFSRVRNKIYLNSFVSIFVLLCTVFYLPLFNGRLLDICYIILVVISFRELVFNKSEQLLIITILLNAGVVTISGTIFGNTEPYFSYFIIRLLLVYIVYTKIISINLYKFSIVLFVFLLINCIAIILDFFNLQSIEPFFLFIKDTGAGVNHIYRASGLFTGYYSAAVMIATMLLFFYFNKQMALFSISMLLVFFSLFASARSGFIVLLLFFLYLVIEFVFSKKIKINRIIIILSIPVIMITGIKLLIPYLPYYAVYTYNMFLQISELFIGNIEDVSSVNTLITQQFYLTESWTNIIFGNNGRPFTELNWIRSDSGYIQLLYGMGAFGAIIYLSFFVYLKRNFGAKYINFVILIMFVLSIKGSLFYSYIFIDYLLILTAITNRDS